MSEKNTDDTYYIITNGTITTKVYSSPKRSDTISIKNTTESETAATCSITYTSKWTVVESGNGDSIKLAKNSTYAPQQYNSYMNNITANYFTSDAAISTAKNSGALKPYDNTTNYVSADSKISNNLTNEFYWVGENEINIGENINLYQLTYETLPFSSKTFECANFECEVPPMPEENTVVGGEASTMGRAATSTTPTHSIWGYTRKLYSEDDGVSTLNVLKKTYPWTHRLATGYRIKNTYTQGSIFSKNENVLGEKYLGSGVLQIRNNISQTSAGYHARDGYIAQIVSDTVPSSSRFKVSYAMYEADGVLTSNWSNQYRLSTRNCGGSGNPYVHNYFYNLRYKDANSFYFKANTSTNNVYTSSSNENASKYREVISKNNLKTYVLYYHRVASINFLQKIRKLANKDLDRPTLVWVQNGKIINVKSGITIDNLINEAK